MTCQGCAHTIEKALASVPGVRGVEVNFGSRTARVERDPERATPAALRRAVSAAGYRVPDDAGELGSLRDQIAFGEAAEEADLIRLRRESLLSLALSALLLALGSRIGTWPSIVLATGVVLGAGWRVLSSGWRAARVRSPDMNSLVALGAGSALGAATVSALVDGALGSPDGHLRAAVLIVTFVLLGRWMEGRARSRTGGAVRALLDLTPPQARILKEGREVEVPLARLRPGELVLVRPGERIPVDGEVVEGSSTVDESSLTGESAAVERGPGEGVHAGTLNGLGALSIRARGIGADSVLGRIAEAVHEIQGSRAPVQRLADRISAVFVPIVLAIAVLSLIAWLAGGAGWEVSLRHAIAVLVVACPCALGLATPTAILVAGARGARESCLLRSAVALETLAGVDTVVLDKTGTLTRGEPRLTRIDLLAPEVSEEEALTFAAAVERHSEQPLAGAIVRAARERELPDKGCSGFTADPGRGVLGLVERNTVWIGSPRAARARDEDEFARAEPVLAELEEAGATAGPCWSSTDG